MDLTILTPTRKIVEKEEVVEVLVPATVGTLDILPNHANIVSELETGVLKWRSGSNWKSASISFGWLEIHDQHITVLADMSELGNEINVERAKKAESNAKEKLNTGGLDQDGFARWELKLKRAMARQSAAI